MAFQAAYVGGHTTKVAPPPVIEVNEFPFAVGGFWSSPIDTGTDSDAPVGPNDIRLIVNTVVDAARQCELPPALKPWLPELATTYRLEQLPTRRTDDELVFGVIDHPDDQAQPVVAFVSDRDSNMAIFGTGGSGKSTALRTIAVAAGFSTARGGPCEVYALDYGSRQLSMLEALPHVGAVIYADDPERTQRLLRMLRGMIEERSERYSEVKAGTIGEYRSRSGNSSEPRVLLLIDNFGAFRQVCDANPSSGMFEMVERLAAEGRGVGIHLIATADRSAAFSAGMNSLIQAKLALRLASEMDYAVLGVPADVFSESSPPGRGYMDGSEVQIAVLGGEANSAKQAAEIGRLAKAMDRANVPHAPEIRRLPEFVEHSSLPTEVDGLPVLGLWDETLEPLGFEPSGVFVVAGPPQSGRTTAVASLVTSLLRRNPSAPMALLAARRSTLPGLAPWSFVAADNDSIAELARDLALKISTDDPSVAGLTVVIEGVGALSGTLADDAVQSLVTAARNEGLLVIAEGETSSLAGWGLPQMVRADKYGVLLQPEQMDGDSLLGT
ncbi:MAG: FtsK/SpoIIIE domain-containing protein, partial [Ilumatobacteraceae bacterium]